MPDKTPSSNRETNDSLTMGRLIFSQDWKQLDHRSFGNFWQRAKRCLNFAPRMKPAFTVKPSSFVLSLFALSFFCGCTFPSQIEHADYEANAAVWIRTYHCAHASV